ncbi:MAG: hypothetical protein Q8M24_00455 [Pseudolabrys sp.]|nr:hypothetical protein [Pseudolabrys sp.]MDP2293917.1 hypothetical protein [Pseudolabrys sp.]
MGTLDNDVIPSFTAVKSLADIQFQFFRSARNIIQNYALSVRGACLYPTSLELYLKMHNRRDIWFDASTDKGEEAKEQLNRGTWYIRQKKAPRRWRIDITAGSRIECIQAGILIRQLDGLGGPQPGPATSLHRIVRGIFGDLPWTLDEVEFIRQIHGKRVDGSDGSPLVLVRRKVPLSSTLATGKRINLPKSAATNNEGISIRDAHLRVSIWRKHSADEIIADQIT